MEFQAADAETHKDEVTCSAEAVHELQRILAEARGLSKDEVNTIKVHMAIAGGYRIQFFTLRADYRERGVFTYIRDAGPTFNLAQADLKTTTLEALQLCQYLHQVVVPDGLKINGIFSRNRGDFDDDLLCSLPKLPRFAPKPRESTAKFTPAKKRVRFLE